MKTSADLIAASIAPSSARAYRSGVNRLEQWLGTVCVALGTPPFQLSTAAGLRAVLEEPTLVGAFIAFLHLEGVDASTAATYLDGIRHFATDLEGHPAPSRHPGVALVLRGMRSRQPASDEQPSIRMDSLRDMVRAIPTLGLLPMDAAALEAAMTMAYYGALRVSEYLVSGDRAKLLTRGDVTVSPDGQSMTVSLKKTKTNQTGPPQLVIIPARGGATSLCPVASMLRYLVLRDARFGANPVKPFFGRASGIALTSRVFNNLVKQAGRAAGVRDWRNLASHALRAGSTTDAVANGADFLAVKAHGRWRSDGAPAAYIRQAAGVEAARRVQQFLDEPQHRVPQGPMG